MGNIILVKRISRAIAEVLRLENQIQVKEKRTAFVNFKVKQIFYVIIFVFHDVLLQEIPSSQGLIYIIFQCSYIIYCTL
jgi:hypothetical protein